MSRTSPLKSHTRASRPKSLNRKQNATLRLTQHPKKEEYEEYGLFKFDEEDRLFKFDEELDEEARLYDNKAPIYVLRLR